MFSPLILQYYSQILLITNIQQQYLLIEFLKDVFDGVKLHFPRFCTGHQITTGHYDCVKQFSVGLISTRRVKTKLLFSELHKKRTENALLEGLIKHTTI